MKIEDIRIPSMEELRKFAKNNKLQLKDVATLADVPVLCFYSKNPTYKTLVKVCDALKQLCILEIDDFKK